MAHGLPRGLRNRPENGAATSGTRRRYRDVRYVGLGLVVELDGALVHPAERAWRDRWRDNELTIEGDRTLRYGWREVAGRPCAVAGQVGSGLRAAGWSGVPHPCGPGCAIA
ncbi:MAG: hypothetical protein JNL54_14520 [Kineosporiaceae bacterium]|nr:hypothetical protein [Kineosporiaceae bacterium]